MAPKPIFHFNHPKIRIKTTLAGNRTVQIRLISRNQLHPIARPALQVKRALKNAALPVQKVELDQNRPRRGVSALDKEGRNISKAQTLLGYAPDVKIDTGIRAAMPWYIGKAITR